MPLAPIAAVMAPKAGAAMATALAVGVDDLAHHGQDLVHSVHDHATAFIHLPIAKQRLYHMVADPVTGLWNKMFGAGEQGHMVDYFAAGCPHCKHIEPVWKDAAGLWEKQGGTDANHVVWEQKQCLDENWKPGPDFKECQAQHISRFPTIRFFPPGSKTGEDFFLERTPEKLVDFAKTGISPVPGTMARLPGDVSDMKLVDFYAAACPHCKTLEPVWDDAHKQWDKAIGQSEEAPREDLPLISFEKKECYDSHWNPGRDSAECQKFHVDAFPSIKLFVPDPHGHGFSAVDYDGDRTPQAIVDFLKDATGMPAETPQAVDAAHHEPAQADVINAAIAGARVEAAAASPDQDVGPTEQELPLAFQQAAKTAMIPLPLLGLSCLPVRRNRAPHSFSCQAPPGGAAQFI